MNIQASINEGRGVVENLLDKPPISLGARTMYEIPEESGIYVFSDIRHINLCMLVKAARIREGRVYLETA